MYPHTHTAPRATPIKQYRWLQFCHLWSHLDWVAGRHDIRNCLSLFWILLPVPQCVSNVGGRWYCSPHILYNSAKIHRQRDGRSVRVKWWFIKWLITCLCCRHGLEYSRPHSHHMKAVACYDSGGMLTLNYVQNENLSPTFNSEHQWEVIKLHHVTLSSFSKIIKYVRVVEFIFLTNIPKTAQLHHCVCFYNVYTDVQVHWDCEWDSFRMACSRKENPLRSFRTGLFLMCNFTLKCFLSLFVSFFLQGIIHLLCGQLHPSPLPLEALFALRLRHVATGELQWLHRDTTLHQVLDKYLPKQSLNDWRYVCAIRLFVHMLHIDNNNNNN